MSLTEDANLSFGGLPAGAHPGDKSSPVDGPQWGHSSLPQDTPGSKAPRAGRAPYQVENPEALPVYERGSTDWAVNLIYITATNGGTAIAANDQKGRKSVTLSIPTALPGGQTAVGVLFGPTEDSVQTIFSAGVLNVGDSVTLGTEAKVYVGLLPGQVFGSVQVIVESNPSQGPI
jgi:hypothetical protein